MTDHSYVIYPEMVVVQQCLLVTVSKVHLYPRFFPKRRSLLTERRQIVIPREMWVDWKQKLFSVGSQLLQYGKVCVSDKYGEIEEC